MDNLHDEDASNIVFFASNEPFKFTVPAHGDYKDPIYNTYFYVRRSSTGIIALCFRSTFVLVKPYLLFSSMSTV